MIGLHKLRTAKGYTQKEVAQALGVRQNTISQWESGDRKPDIINLKKLAAFLECSIEDLLEGV